MPNSESDKIDRLVARIQQTDISERQELWIELIKEIAPKLQTFIVYRIAKQGSSPEAVEDLVSEIFLSLFKSIDRFDTTRSTSFLTFAYATASHHIADYLRGQHVRESLAHTFSDQLGPSNPLERAARNLEVGLATGEASQVTVRFDIFPPLSSSKVQALVLPTINSLEHLNSSVVSFLYAAAEADVNIEKISFSSPLDITLGGFIPETIEVIRQITKDRSYRNQHEANEAKLAEAKTAAELEQIKLENKKRELELQAMLLKQVRDTIDLIAPNAPPEQRALIAAKLLPDVQFLLTSGVTIIIDQPPEQ